MDNHPSNQFSYNDLLKKYSNYNKQFSHTALFPKQKQSKIKFSPCEKEEKKTKVDPLIELYKIIGNNTYVSRDRKNIFNKQLSSKKSIIQNEVRLGSELNLLERQVKVRKKKEKAVLVLRQNEEEDEEVDESENIGKIDGEGRNDDEKREKNEENKEINKEANRKTSKNIEIIENNGNEVINENYNVNSSNKSVNDNNQKVKNRRKFWLSCCF
jgi:hypothetical protein